MYEVKWMPKTAAELEELCNKAVEHGFDLVACNDNFCVFKSAQQSVQADEAISWACKCGTTNRIERVECRKCHTPRR